MFETKPLPTDPDVIAPDGSNVRLLLSSKMGSMAHFELPPGQTSLAVKHRTVSEIWYITGGRGEMWRRMSGHEEVVPLETGICLTIPLGTEFQFRSGDKESLTAIAITMPPWPGPGEAVFVEGNWESRSSKSL